MKWISPLGALPCLQQNKNTEGRAKAQPLLTGGIEAREREGTTLLTSGLTDYDPA